MIKIGILGTGQISSALVEGFCTAGTEMTRVENMHFYVSPRNETKARILMEKYPAQVTVCSTNQEVLDLADDWVILAVIPHVAESIIRPLKFRSPHKILSLISDHPLKRIEEWTGPTKKLIRMVPLPFAELHIGPIASYPPDEEIRRWFAPLGQVIELEDEDDLNTILTLTSMMSPFYLLIHHSVEWSKAHGITDRASLDYISSFFEALSVMARGASDSQAVARLCFDTTKGGLNESAYKYITDQGGYDIWMEALDAVKKRLDKDNPFLDRY